MLYNILLVEVTETSSLLCCSQNVKHCFTASVFVALKMEFYADTSVHKK